MTTNTNIPESLLNNFSVAVRNCTEGCMVLVKDSKGNLSEFEVMERIAHRGRGGRAILVLKNLSTNNVLRYGALEMLQNFGSKVYFCPSATPIPTGTDGRKPENLKPSTPSTPATAPVKPAVKVQIQTPVSAPKTGTVPATTAPVPVIVPPSVPAVTAPVVSSENDSDDSSEEFSEESCENDANEVANEATEDSVSSSEDLLASMPATDESITEGIPDENGVISIDDLLRKWKNEG